MILLRTPIWTRHDCELTLGQALCALAAVPFLIFALALTLAIGG